MSERYLLGLDGVGVECAVDVTEIMAMGLSPKHTDTLMRWLMKEKDTEAGCLMRGDGVIVGMYHMQ